MKIIRISVTNTEGELLDVKSIEVPDDHTYIYVSSGNAMIAPMGNQEELKIGK